MPGVVRQKLQFTVSKDEDLEIMFPVIGDWLPGTGDLI